MSHVEAALVGNFLAVLEKASQHAEIHRPAVAGDPIVLVRARPPHVMKAEPGAAVACLEPEADPRVHPVAVGVHYLELEFGARHKARHPRPPVVLGSEPELVFGTVARLTRRSLGP